MKKFILLALLASYTLAKPTILQVKYKNILVNGKQIRVMTIAQPNGTWGYYANAHESFNVIVENKLDEPTVIHWHGLTLPNREDGTELTQKVIAPHSQYSYNFKLNNIGTFWMHSHYKLQEGLFAEAPLIIESPEDKSYQQVVVMLQDFSFKSPDLIMQGLTLPTAKMDMQHMSMHGMHNMKMDMSSKSEPDLNDVNHDIYLTNYHTPQEPQIIFTNAKQQVKLRFINGSSSSNFWIKLGKLTGKAIAVDGHNIKLISGNEFQLATAQRMDIIVNIPKNGGDFPIIVQVEGRKNETGLILTTNKSLTHASIKVLAKTTAKALDYSQEIKLQSIKELSHKKVDQVIKYTLTGTMSPYAWQINHQTWPNVTPVKIKQGSRVELDFINKSMMAHPMHIHGYSFKVVEVNGKKINGSIRDTILVLPNSSVKVIFDATELGKWLIHCHTLYHMHTGMMTYLEVISNKALISKK